MIEINLVPSNLRKDRKKSLLSSGLNIPLEIIIGLGGGFFILLIIAHIGLLFVNMTKINQHKKLQAQWNEMAPKKTNIDNVIKEMRRLKGTEEVLREMTMGNRVLWSEKLNLISDSVPTGVWLRKIALTKKVLFVEGSAISKQNKEMINVHTFTSELQKDAGFLRGFVDIDLGSIQRRKIKLIEVADFVMTTKLK
ncbi:MAG: PilN domain-containing protein [Candidatus Omnitrophica bacterium]|nr:PilN domain-containing protein [Candidatus Omnitrophota bacterium]